VADALFRDSAGKPRHDFRGKLSFSWPKRADQTPLNFGDPGYDPLFAFGYGLRYGQPGEVAQLSEERPAPSSSGADGNYFARGATPPGWSLAPAGGAAARAIDRRGQEDSRLVTFTGVGEQSLVLTASQPLDISREANAQLSLLIDYRLDARPTAPVFIAVNQARVTVSESLRGATAGEWRTLAIPLGCFAKAGADMAKVQTPFALTTAGRLTIAISDVRIASAAVPQDRCSL
jgi:beta-glucosidase